MAKCPLAATARRVYTLSSVSLTPARLPPGPRDIPIIGQAISLNPDKAHLQFTEWRKLYGDLFIFRLLGKNCVVLNHPEIVRNLFSRQEFLEVTNDRPGGFMAKYVLNDSQDVLFRQYDDRQKCLKESAVNFIENHTAKDETFYEQVSVEIQQFTAGLRTHMHKDIDLMEFIDPSVSKQVALMLCGKLLSDTDPAMKSFLGFEQAANELGKVKNQMALSACPFLRHAPGKLGGTFRKLAENRDKLLKFFITDTRDMTDKFRCKGLVDALMERALKEKQTRDDWLSETFIHGVVMDMTPAAVKPIQGSLSVLLLLLVNYPHIQQKIRAEVISVVGKERQPKLTDLPNMPYTHACLQELMRYHTPLPLSARHHNRIEIEFDGFIIPKNTDIYTNLWGIHHDQRFWKEPECFKPERFLSEKGKLLPDDHPLRRNYIPYGVGPRACAGKTFGRNSLFLYLTNIVQNFLLLPSSSEEVPVCDVNYFQPGVVTRAPSFKVRLTDASKME
ncbi:hypothetical protein CHS0354_040452 [Potamilus streckersoni]|nr:hypothetical protein CHS0354_040452 [Potamilus streckersoni]